MVPRVIICDDEPLMVNILAKFCKDTGIVEVVRLKAGNISRGIIKEKPWEIPFKYAYAVMCFQGRHLCHFYGTSSLMKIS